MNCATTSQEDKGFNSKLVRLEGCELCYKIRGKAGVSIQTGAIKRQYAHMCSNGTCAQFRFQTGAIKFDYDLL